MALLVVLFLKLNESQAALIQHLSQTNQSLLNQVRAKDIGTLQGLTVATSAPVSEEYMTTDDREMNAYREALASNYEFGEVLYDEQDVAELKAVL